MFKGLEGEVGGLLKEVIELSYFMRGSVQYESMMNKTHIERQLISEFLSARLESESNKLNPNY